MPLTRNRDNSRILWLLLILEQEQEGLTSASLAESLDCTQQEIQRALRKLRKMGFTVWESEKRPKRYKITERPIVEI